MDFIVVFMFSLCTWKAYNDFRGSWWVGFLPWQIEAKFMKNLIESLSFFLLMPASVFNEGNMPRIKLLFYLFSACGNELLEGRDLGSGRGLLGSDFGTLIFVQFFLSWGNWGAP